MLILKRLLGNTSIAGLGCLIALAFVAIVLVLNTALVALVWNGLDLHGVFNAGTLSFHQCIAAAAILMLFGV